MNRNFSRYQAIFVSCLLVMASLTSSAFGQDSRKQFTWVPPRSASLESGAQAIDPDSLDSAAFDAAAAHSKAPSIKHDLTQGETYTHTVIKPRGGSFGGGGRGFGGGSSFGGGGFRSSSGGSFGGSARPFGGGGNSSPRTSSSARTSSSFGRSGQMNSSGPIRSTSISRPSGRYYYQGRYYPGYGGGFWGGYSYGWYHPAWYYYTPFWPTFYFNPPYVVDGVMYPGGFNWVKFFFGLVIIIFIFWLIGRMFGGGKGVRYTTYR